jgi:hypothetical protein
MIEKWATEGQDEKSRKKRNATCLRSAQEKPP